MSKTDNVKQTGKPFKWMKILLICMIGCMIGLITRLMYKLLKRFAKPLWAHGLIMEQAMLLCIVFISFVVIVNFKAFITITMPFNAH